MAANLPEFERPPVVEVAISVQFDAPALDGPQVMLRWSEVRGRFPKYEIAPPMPRFIEGFDGLPTPEFQIQFSNVPAMPQLLMMTETGEEALQLQGDRIGYTWRKLYQDDAYPSYAHLSERFREELSEFEAFIARENLESFYPAQCELAYVDALLPEPGVWAAHSDLGKVIPSAAPRLTGGFLPDAEKTLYNVTYLIPDEAGRPLGRLHIAVEPRLLETAQTPMYLMKTTARGAPKGRDISAILATLDLWHSWVLRAFVDLTSPEMHRAWGRTV